MLQCYPKSPPGNLPAQGPSMCPVLPAVPRGSHNQMGVGAAVGQQQAAANPEAWLEQRAASGAVIHLVTPRRAGQITSV